MWRIKMYFLNYVINNLDLLEDKYAELVAYYTVEEAYDYLSLFTGKDLISIEPADITDIKEVINDDIDEVYKRLHANPLDNLVIIYRDWCNKNNKPHLCAKEQITTAWSKEDKEWLNAFIILWQSMEG